MMNMPGMGGGMGPGMPTGMAPMGGGMGVMPQPPQQPPPQQQQQPPQPLDNISKIKSLVGPLRDALSVSSTERFHLFHCPILPSTLILSVPEYP